MVAPQIARNRNLKRAAPGASPGTRFPAKGARYSPGRKLPGSPGEENGVFQRPVPLGFKSASRGSGALTSPGARSCRSPGAPGAGAREYSPGAARARAPRAAGRGHRGRRAERGGQSPGCRLPGRAARRLRRSVPGRRAGSGDRFSPPAGRSGPRCRWLRARESGAATGLLWESQCPRQVQSARPGCSRTRLGAGTGRAPRSPPRAGRANLCAGSGALTMEHGLREAGVVMMTAAAARAGSHSPWSLPGPWRARRCRASGRAAVCAAGSSAPRRARRFIHPRGGGPRRGGLCALPFLELP